MRDLVIATTSKTTAEFQPEPFELASPFLISILIILVSALLVPFIVRRLRRHFEEGWTPTELKEVLPSRSPNTHAAAGIWAMDAAQIPSMLGTPAASAVLLFHKLPKGFLVGYTAVLAGGLIFFVIFIEYISPLSYRRHALKIWKVRFSPLVIIGVVLNLVGAAVAAVFIK